MNRENPIVYVSLLASLLATPAAGCGSSDTSAVADDAALGSTEGAASDTGQRPTESDSGDGGGSMRRSDAGSLRDGAVSQDAGTSSDAPGPRESAAASDAGAGIDWTPGHYVLLAKNSVTDQATELNDLLGGKTVAPYTMPVITPFAGIVSKYFWADFEGAEGDYSAGFAKLDAEMAAVASKGKKLIPMLNYKTFTTDSGAPASAVPAYMLTSGPWCVTPSGGAAVCGQYDMSNGIMAMIWQTGTAVRVHAWLAAAAAHVAASPNRASVAGFILPESACSAGSIPLDNVGYTQPSYEQALTDDVTALVTADPRHVAFQYINFLPPNATGQTYLTDLANFAKMTPGAGLGCPDVAPSSSSWGPPGYATLMNASYQTVVPFNVAVEAMDYEAPRASSVASTYDVAVTQMKAGQVTWLDIGASSSTVFGIGDVAQYIAARPFPNTTPPSW